MGEIDHADDAVDHRVADRDQAIDRAEHDTVDQLLGEIIHALPLFDEDAAMAPAAGTPRRWYFLTAGTRSGNCAGYRMRRLYTASFRRFRRHARNKSAPRTPGAIKVNKSFR